jgi:hypothetical protein
MKADLTKLICKEKSMKTWGKKCIMVLSALVIAFGTMTMITSCKKSEAPKTPAAKDANMPAPAKPAE